MMIEMRTETGRGIMTRGGLTTETETGGPVMIMKTETGDPVMTMMTETGDQDMTGISIKTIRGGGTLTATSLTPPSWTPPSGTDTVRFQSTGTNTTNPRSSSRRDIP